MGEYNEMFRWNLPFAILTSFVKKMGCFLILPVDTLGREYKR
jgi:hypothetical protein